MKIIELSPLRELHIHADRFSVYTGKLCLFVFYISSSLSIKNKQDVDTEIHLKSCDEKSAVWQAVSTVWNQKEYRLEAIDGCFIFTVTVKGKGAPTVLNYFTGKGDGSRFFTAGYTLFNMQEYDRERSMFLMGTKQEEKIEPLRAAPPPFLFPFFNDYTPDVIGLGIAAKKGCHNFQQFELHTPKNGWNENRCWFTLPLEEYTEVSGEWTSPMLWGGFAKSDMGALSLYSEWQYKHLGFKKNIAAADAPKWWHQPIFCGWGAQGDLRSTKTTLKASEYCSQSIYEGFDRRLEELGINPGIIMIDDRWQKKYGVWEPDPTRFQNLRAFADAQHQKGRHVVLWIKCWDKTGLDEVECIFANGKPFCADPTSPKYHERLKQEIYRLLSADEGCCNCDGFKLDFFDNHPRTGGARAYTDGVFGLELMKHLISRIYRYAKAAKPDALINASCCHPYFAECVDEFRIHDYDGFVRSPLSTMKFRADTVKAVLPDILIDMDGFRGRIGYETTRILLEQPKLGVPDLYYFPTECTEKDIEAVRLAWESYRKTVE